jgi:ribose 1,5-bisphosphokinase PhnN
MAGVLEHLFRPQQKTIYQDQKAMELEAAKEILAEVFGMRLSEVEEMLRQRSEVEAQSCKEEGALWPESFHLTE